MPLVPACAREERRVRTTGDFAEAEVQHLRDEALDQRLAIAADRLVVLGLALESDGHRPALRFRIRRHVDQRVLVRRHAGVHGGRRAGRGGDAAEVRLHHLLGLGHRDVADHHHRHLIGAIPLLVERHQPLARRVLENFGQADRQALRVARALEDHRQLLVGQPRARAEAAAPFFEDDAAFLFDFGRQERNAGGEILQHRHAAIDIARAIGRDVEHVDGFVERRRRVDVRTEARADRFEERHQLARLEMLGAVERHVLEEVRQAALIGIFLHGAGVDRQPHRHAIGGPRILADEVAEAVRQPSGLHRRIDRQRSRQRELGGNRGWSLRRGHLRGRRAQRASRNDKTRRAIDEHERRNHAISWNPQHTIRQCV